MIVCVLLNLINVFLIAWFTYAKATKCQILNKEIIIGEYSVNVQLFIVLVLVVLFVLTKVMCKLDLKVLKRKYQIPKKYESAQEFIKETRHVWKHEFYYSLIRLFYWVVVIVLGWIIIINNPLNGESFEYRIFFIIVKIAYILFKIILPIAELIIIIFLISRIYYLKDGDYDLESNYCKQCNHGAMNIIIHTPDILVNSELIKTEKNYGVNDGISDFIKYHSYGYELYRDDFEKRHTCINCGHVVVEKHTHERKEYLEG